MDIKILSEEKIATQEKMYNNKLKNIENDFVEKNKYFYSLQQNYDKLFNDYKILDIKYNESLANKKELEIKLIEFQILYEKYKNDKLDAQILIDEKILSYEQTNKNKIIDIENKLKNLQNENRLLSSIIQKNNLLEDNINNK